MYDYLEVYMTIWRCDYLEMYYYLELYDYIYLQM